MDKTAEALKDRTKRFLLGVLDFVETMPQRPASDTIARQLARAGVGAGNYRSACRARPHVEVTARLGGEASQRTRLLGESRELVAIFSKGCETARRDDRTHASRKR